MGTKDVVQNLFGVLDSASLSTNIHAASNVRNDEMAENNSISIKKSTQHAVTRNCKLQKQDIPGDKWCSNNNTSRQHQQQGTYSPTTKHQQKNQLKRSQSALAHYSSVKGKIDRITRELIDKRAYTHPFFQLPETARVKILKYLTHTERLLAMWVCRRFRNEIKYRVGFRTKITEETPNSPVSMKDLLVTSIIVGKFDRPVSPLSRMIANPENITELIFEEPICVQHLDAFLNRCRRLKWLIIRSSIVDTSAFPLNAKTLFTGYEWRSLDVIYKSPIPQVFLKELSLTIPGVQCIRTINRCLDILSAPSMARFTLVITTPIAFEETTAVHCSVLNFLKTCLLVDHIIICTEQRPSTVKYSSRTTQVQALERELNVSTEKLHLKQVILTEPAVAFEIWNVVLNNQNTLEVLQICHMTIWPLLKDIVATNAKTLVKVALHVILWDKHGKHTALDLTVFNRINNLKELYICVAPPAAEGLVDFINFAKLPKSLEILGLKNCHVQVKDFLFVRSLLQLKSLGIVSLGNIDGNYMGIKTLRKLVHIRTLEELFISGLVESSKEGEEMKNLINRMKARVKTKSQRTKTFHCFDEVNRWATKNGTFTFTIFTNYL